MTAEELKVKDWLQRAFYADKKLKALEMLLRASRMHADGLVHCRQYNNTGKSDTALNGTENAYIKIADIECRCTIQKQKLKNISGEIEEAISRLHDSELEAVLIHRYLLFHTVDQTAEFLNYSPETVKRRQRKAIEKLTRCDLV